MVDFLSLMIEPVAAGEPFGRNRHKKVSIPRILSNFRQCQEKGASHHVW
jgi:hypothetical protein